jgi:hypothetical protein
MMAPKKQKGAPASDAGSAIKKKTRKEKKVVNSLHYAKSGPASRRAAHAEIRETLSGTQVTSISLKPACAQKGPKHYIKVSDTLWTEELGAKLFTLFATAHTLDEVAALEGMPPLFTLLTWLATQNNPFAVIYKEARERMIPLIEDRAVTAASKPYMTEIVTTREVIDKDGEIREVTERKIVDNTARSQLAADAYRWLLAVKKPKTYGRQPDGPGGANEQLEGLFASLRAGPVEKED